MVTNSAFLYIDMSKGQPVQLVYVYVFIYMSVYAVLLVKKYYIYVLFILLVVSLPYLSNKVIEAGDRSLCNLFVICQNHACLFYNFSL